MATLTTKEHEIINLKSRLAEGEVEFEYTKKDGTVRTARGTTNFNIIPEKDFPKGNNPVAPETVRYYDLDSEGWRSFIRDNFIRIVE